MDEAFDLNVAPRMRCGCGKELRRLHRTNADGTPKGDRDGHFWGCPECSTLLTPLQFSQRLRALRHRWHEARRAAGLEPKHPVPIADGVLNSERSIIGANDADLSDDAMRAAFEELALRLTPEQAVMLAQFLHSIGRVDFAGEFVQLWRDARRRLGLPPPNGALHALADDLMQFRDDVRDE